VPNVADRACAYGIPGEVVDGMDVLAVRAVWKKPWRALAPARPQHRGGQNVSLFRPFPFRPARLSHARRGAGYKDRDPIIVLSEEMKAVGLLSEDEFESMNQQVKGKLKDAMAYSEAPPLRIPPKYPRTYSPPPFHRQGRGSEAELRAKVKADGGMRQISYAEAIQEALREEMTRDADVFIMGEDVGLYGGAYGATRKPVPGFGDGA
jgi:hypothetical protein